MTNFRIVLWTSAVTGLLIGCLGCYQSRTETIQTNHDDNRFHSTMQDNRAETVPIFESSVGRSWQYRYDPNISDSEITNAFERIGRGESRANSDFLYSCQADSIVPYLASENYDIKTRAIFVLGSIGDTAAVMVLAEIMSPVFLTLSDSDLNHANYALANIDGIIRNRHLLISHLPLLHPHLMKYALGAS